MACRQAEGIAPLVQLVRAGPRNQAATCAAAALTNLAANNGINQQSLADCGGLEAVVDLLKGAALLPNPSRLASPQDLDLLFCSGGGSLTSRLAPFLLHWQW